MIIQTFFIFNLSPLLFSPPSLFISVPFLHLIFSFASEIPFDTVFRRKIPDSSCYIFPSLQLYTSFRLFRLFFSYLEKNSRIFTKTPSFYFNWFFSFYWREHDERNLSRLFGLSRVSCRQHTFFILYPPPPTLLDYFSSHSIT